MKNEIRISCRDGFVLSGTLFSVYNPPSGVVVIAPALGVPGRFYFPFASYLSENGFSTVVFDYRGISDSGASYREEMVLEDWGKKDIDAVLEETFRLFPSKPVFLLGHSCGGQIFGLTPWSEKLAGAILVSSQIVHWRLWPPPMKWGLFFLWRILIPILCHGRSIFPARALRLSSVDLPTGIMAQWAKWACHRDYLFSSELGIDVHRYGQFSFPILVYSTNDDTYAPNRAVNALVQKFENARIEHLRIRAGDLGVGKIGHFGFFQDKVRDSIWPKVIDWLLSHSNHP